MIIIIIIVIGSLGTVHKEFEKETGRVSNRKKNLDYADRDIVGIG